MEQTKLKAVAYMSWHTDMLPNNARLTNEADVEPILLLLKQQFANVDIDKMFFDTKCECPQLNFNEMLEALTQNKYDYVLVPSMTSLTPYLSDFRAQIEKIKEISPTTEVYFMLEAISTDNKDWEMAVAFIYTLREEQERQAKRKRELMKQMREIQSGQKG